jgi:hypothetical protein
MVRLLEVLRGHDACCVMDDVEWDAMLALAEEEHVAAWVATCLRRSCPSMTHVRDGRLQQIERVTAIAAFYWICQLKRLLAEFAEKAIEVVPLKGPFLAERIYGAAAMRGCRDLDVLVGTADLARAEMVLADSGFVAGEPDDYHREWTRRGATVELHHDVENPLAYNFAIADVLRRSHSATFQGEVCRQFSPEDELLYLCLHAARHRYERMSLIVDLRLAFEKLTVHAGQWTPSDELRHLNGLVLLGLAMVQRLDPDFEVRLVIDASAKYRAHLEGVADGLWGELMTQTSRPLNWHAAHSFYMQIEEPGWARARRWGRHMRILAGRMIEADLLFASRFGLHRAWQARILRPVRLLSEIIGGRGRGHGDQ